MPIYVQNLEVISDNQDLTLTNTATTFGTTLKIPTGTSSERPGSPDPGAIRYNTEVNQVEGYTGLAWVPLRTPTYTLSNSASSIREGDTVTFTLSTSGVEDGTLVPWFIIAGNASLAPSAFTYWVNTANAVDLVNGASTGNFNVVSGSATQQFTFRANDDVLYVIGNSNTVRNANVGITLDQITPYSGFIYLDTATTNWMFAPTTGAVIYYSAGKTIYRNIMNSSQPHNLGNMTTPAQQSRTITSAGTLVTATLNQDRSKFFWWNTTGLMLQHNFVAIGDLNNLATTSEATWRVGNSNVAATSVSGLAWSSNGHRLYLTSNSNNAVLAYSTNLGTISPAPTYINSFSLANTNPRSISFNIYGNKMYIAYNTSIDQYNLSTPWNIATASYNSSVAISSIWSSGTPTQIRGIAHRPIGKIITSDSLTAFWPEDELFTLAINTIPISNTIRVQDVDA